MHGQPEDFWWWLFLDFWMDNVRLHRIVFALSHQSKSAPSYYVRFYFHLLFKKILHLSILCFHIITAVAVDISSGDLDETERIWVLSKKSAQKINHIEIILQ